MGGGMDRRYCDGDYEADEARAWREHECLSLEEKIDNCRDITRLSKVLELATARIETLNTESRLATERAARELAFNDELAATATKLREKYGL